MYAGATSGHLEFELIFVALRATLLWSKFVREVRRIARDTFAEAARIGKPAFQRDVLFKLDPRPYQYVVDQKNAQLAEAEQNVKQLKAAYDQALSLVGKVKVQVRLAQDEYQAAAARRLVDIAAEGFDLAVRQVDLVPADMIVVPLRRPQLSVVVGSHTYFKQHGRPALPSDLIEHQCIRVRLPSGALLRWQFEKSGQIAQIDVNGPITLDEGSLDRTAVLEGLGLGFLFEQDVEI